MDGDLGKVIRDDIQAKGGMIVLDKIWETASATSPPRPSRSAPSPTWPV